MGWSISWIAVRGKSAEQVRSALGVVPTGETSELCAESDLSATELEGGWYVLTSDRERRFSSQGLLSSLSQGGEVVACSVEEHVMVSVASCWRDGRQLWKVTHDAQDPLGLEHLVVEGTPPPELARLHTEALQELRGDPEPCDYLFDVPVNLAAELVGGFRHDEGDYLFEELRPA